jgi:hypothetical protein
MKITFKGELAEADRISRLARRFLEEQNLPRSQYSSIVYAAVPDGPAFAVWGDEKHVRVYQGNQ